MKSFLHGKKSLSIPPLHPAVSPVMATSAAAQPKPAPAPAPAAHQGPGQATVEVIKEGDKVVRLVVVCTCGERVEIECLYPGGS